MQGDDGKIRSALAIAALMCLLVVPAAAHADVRAINLGDAHETPCAIVGKCTPDLALVSVTYDQTGALIVSAQFWDPLPVYDPLVATRVRVDLGLGLPGTYASCAGYVRVEVGAYQGGVSSSTAAPGAVYIAGSQAPLAVTRMVSADLKTVTVSASGPALAGFDVRCAGADLADDSPDGAAAVVRDPVVFQWFPGWTPLPSITSYQFLGATETTATVMAFIAAGGGPATAHIDVGKRKNSYTSAGPDSAPFTTTGWVTLQVTGLTPGTTYHYRIAATALDTRVSHPEYGVFAGDYVFTTQGAAPRPSVITPPTVRGARKVGALLTCSHGHWKLATGFTFRWLRNGRRIARASSRLYRVTLADRGQVLRCSVTARSANASRVSASGALRIP